MSMLPRQRSQMAFSRGARKAVRSSSMSVAVATWMKAGPYVVSLSRMRYVGRWSNGVASRSCCAAHASVGWRVTPTCTIRREASSITQHTSRGRKSRSVTGKKSHAQLSFPWLRRKVAQVCLDRRGGRALRSYFWMVDVATRMSSFRSSPRMRAAPQVRLAVAIARISAIASGAMGGRCAGAVAPDFQHQHWRKSWRCHRSRVSGWTMSRA